MIKEVETQKSGIGRRVVGERKERSKKNCKRGDLMERKEGTVYLRELMKESKQEGKRKEGTNEQR